MSALGDAVDYADTVNPEAGTARQVEPEPEIIDFVIEQPQPEAAPPPQAKAKPKAKQQPQPQPVNPPQAQGAIPPKSAYVMKQPLMTKASVMGLLATGGFSLVGLGFAWLNGLCWITTIAKLFKLNPEGMGLMGVGLWIVPMVISGLEVIIIRECAKLSWWKVALHSHKLVLFFWAVFTALDLWFTSQAVGPWLLTLDYKGAGLPDYLKFDSLSKFAITATASVVVALLPEPILEKFGGEFVFTLKRFFGFAPLVVARAR
ncbi:MAG: hypothetical protein WCS37_10895 [Chloroflexota bacterium]